MAPCFATYLFCITVLLSVFGSYVALVTITFATRSSNTTSNGGLVGAFPGLTPLLHQRDRAPLLFEAGFQLHAVDHILIYDQDPAVKLQFISFFPRQATHSKAFPRQGCAAALRV